MMTPRFLVSDFIAVVNQSLEVAFGVVEVEGEVSSFNINQQKYVFFDLKDDSGVINCFMMVFNLRVPIEDGMRVVVRAIPKLTNRGRFSLTVQAIKPIGEGDIKKSLALLKERLAKEGLFDLERKRSLPKRPSRVAVISSTQAAGYVDFMKIASDRWGSVKFQVANVRVQGDEAADQIIKAINYFGQMAEPPEALVLVRGGGSAEDLSVFNDELLVRAVAGSRVPVLTGIGHEVDESLVDLAADVRAATPSNAAQILLPDKQEFIDKQRMMLRGVVARIDREIDEQIEKVALLKNKTLQLWGEYVELKIQSVLAQRKLIDEYDPEKVLRRGYAMIEGDLAVDSVVKITTKEAILKARIEDYEKR